MEEWELEFEWLRVRHLVKDMLANEKLPELNTILLLIGIQEYGRMKEEFTKEEKQDLMHVAVCTLLSFDGVYAFKGRDEDGWPHFDLMKPIPEKGVERQELLLKKYTIKYFNDWQKEQEALPKQNL